MIGVFKKLIGNKKDKDAKALLPYVQKINAEFAQLSSLTHEQLRAETVGFKKYIAEKTSVIEKKISDIRAQTQNPAVDLEEKEKLFKNIEALEKELDETIESALNDILPRAFAVVKETARRFKENTSITVTATDFDRELAARYEHISIQGDKAVWQNSWIAAGNKITWDMVHFDVQLMGGVTLHQGKISEMQTGEGKTLVATLPVYLNALAGKGVHVVTVNDYLAKRDSEWNGPLFQFHGLSVDCIDKHEPHSPDRQKAYNADITFGTNNEYGFDYLRDNMTTNVNMLVQRKHHYAIVDEVDSVLIDDARTPLIISGPTNKGDNKEFFVFKPKIEAIVNEQRRYLNIALADAKKFLTVLDADNVDKKEKDQKLKDGGMALLRAHRGLPKNKALIKFLSEPGIKAFLQKTENYYIADQNKEMPKVDAELLFVIDEKNNSVELTDKGIAFLSKGEDPNYYTLPDPGTEIAKIESMAVSSEEKLKLKDSLMREYTVKAERIHTLNQLLKAYTLFEKDVEYVVMDNKVKIVDEQTGRILEGRRYSDGLHQAIEAKENVKIENPTQTYATVTLQNFFRMYHKLAGMTGTAETEAKEFWDIYKLDVVSIPTNRPMTRKDLNDYVYKTAREKFNAIIDEVAKMREAGRPILVGTTSVEISELLSRMLKMRNIPHQVLNAKLHQKEAEIVANAGLPGTVTIATNMAGRGTDIKLGAGVKEAGGLAIIGTERHESRRVDRQLRGRAGRQGDPGSSQFYVSLEDPLMRLFGSERIAKLMDRLNHKEGEYIQHKWITNSIERAQRKVEENNFGGRKRLLEYDDVMNDQRTVIYARRRNALFGDKLELNILTMFYDHAENIVSAYHETQDYEELKLELLRAFAIEVPFTEEEFNEKPLTELAEMVYFHVIQSNDRKWNNLAENAFPVIKEVYETQGDKFENIVIPVTDGVKTLQNVVNLKEAFETQGKSLRKAVEKNIMLAVIDNEWKEHLREMEDLRDAVRQRQYEQKDPLVIYKLESYKLFSDMLNNVNSQALSFLVKANLPSQDGQGGVRTVSSEQRKTPLLKTSRTQKEADPVVNSGNNQNPQTVEKVQQVVRTEKKIGRNDPCPCGSGKKYKSCHGTNA